MPDPRRQRVALECCSVSPAGKLLLSGAKPDDGLLLYGGGHRDTMYHVVATCQGYVVLRCAHRKPKIRTIRGLDRAPLSSPTPIGSSEVSPRARATGALFSYARAREALRLRPALMRASLDSVSGILYRAGYCYVHAPREGAEWRVCDDEAALGQPARSRDLPGSWRLLPQ